MRQREDSSMRDAITHHGRSLKQKCFEVLKQQRFDIQPSVEVQQSVGQQKSEKAAKPGLSKGNQTDGKSLEQRVEALETAVSSLISQREQRPAATPRVGLHSRAVSFQKPPVPQFDFMRTRKVSDMEYRLKRLEHRRSARHNSMHLIHEIHDKLNSLEGRLVRRCLH